MPFSRGRFESQRSVHVSVWLGMSRRQAAWFQCLQRHRQPDTGVADGSDSQVIAGAHTPETTQRGGHCKNETEFMENASRPQSLHKGPSGCGCDSWQRPERRLRGGDQMEGMSAPRKGMQATAPTREVSKAALQEVASFMNNLRKSSFYLWSKTQKIKNRRKGPGEWRAGAVSP